jgi:ribokinase
MGRDTPTHPSMIFSLGSINVDHVFRIPGAPSGTMVAHDVRVLPGGKAANAAVAARHLGARVALFGWVGDDVAAPIALQGPSSAGVDVAAVTTLSGPTGAAFVLVQPDGDKAIVRVPGVNDAPAADPDSIVTALRGAPAGSVLILDVEVSPRVVHAAVAAAHGQGVRTVLDPAPPDRVNDEIIESAHIITPDHTEAQALTGTPTDTDDGALRAAVLLHERGPSAAIVKLAKGGCALAWNAGSGIVEPPAVAVLDTNGAGDAFAGAVAWAVSNNFGPIDAARVGVAASALATTQRGGQLRSLNPRQFEQLRDRSRFHPA